MDNTNSNDRTPSDLEEPTRGLHHLHQTAIYESLKITTCTVKTPHILYMTCNVAQGALNYQNKKGTDLNKGRWYEMIKRRSGLEPDSLI